MKQMCGRGKFFMASGLPPGGKMRKFDDSRFFFYDGGQLGLPFGQPPPLPDFAFSTAQRMQFHSSGIP